jgi:hypothetical protein
MLSGVSTSIFTDSSSITLTPVVSAEWNHNLFNAPYITTAGTGTKLTATAISPLPTDVSVGAPGAKPNFITKSFTMSSGAGKRSYTISGGSSSAYKVVTYIKTNSPIPVMINASGKGTSLQYGSEQVEADSLGWTKVITYIGSQSATDTFTGFTYAITANSISGTDNNPIVYFTVPEVYATTYFDYQNHSLFPTEIPFTFFRPGESYVQSGDIKSTFPSAYRKITSSVIENYSVSTYSPVTPILQNPKFFLATSPVPVLKNALPTDISPYRYFISDASSKSITAIYEKPITTNKIVIKFNTLMTVPTVNITIGETTITVDGSQSISPPNNAENGRSTGVLTLYWTGTAWTKTKWSTMPQFSSTGALSLSTSISKITVTQVSKSTNPEFSSLAGASNSATSVGSDLNRMHIVEISPRLEIDLTDFVESVSIDKSLDSSNSLLPISSLNTNDAQITLSGVPALIGSTIVPIFSSQSDQASTILANMLRKNIKFYINFHLKDFSSPGSTTGSNVYIPGGVFYSDSWAESDIQNVSIQCFDVSRYLQSLPVADYVANLKSVFEIITNILDLSGFTDYDYDSLYSICNSKTSPVDISYYYCNSKDSTIMECLNEIFVAYQIGAYIDEYGVMQFLSLQDILSSSGSDLSLLDANIIKDGFSISNNAKPGKISLRYQTPQIKQSPSLQNVQDVAIKNSPSFIYTTSNDVVWAQQTMDSVGFNYLDEDMLVDSNTFKLNNNDLLDIFHTFNMSNDGFSFIENEIVSFAYKEYTLSTLDGLKAKTISIKNNIDLSAEIDRFIKEKSIPLRPSYAIVTGASGNGTLVTYTSSNSFKDDDKVMITGVVPAIYNIQGTVIQRTSTSFKVESKATGTYVSGGEAYISADYDVLITPTGNITNVERGLFGTAPLEHKKITTLASKGLSEISVGSDRDIYSTPATTSIVTTKDDYPNMPEVKSVAVSPTGNDSTLIFPTSSSVVDIGYQTYSVKFNLDESGSAAAGLFFNMASSTDITGTYFIELARYNRVDPRTDELYTPRKYDYILSIYNNTGATLYWADVTAECNSIINNFSKVLKKEVINGINKYSYTIDQCFNLKIAHYLSDGSDGENATTEDQKRIMLVFLNNVEITKWQFPGQEYDETTSPSATGWESPLVNHITGMRQRPYFVDNFSTGTKFGFHASKVPNQITNLYPQKPVYNPTSNTPATLREIHATVKPLIERSVSYFYQDREFLNGLVQNQPLYTKSPTYLMQTTPEVSGINYYDVQYQTPAAVSVDILPVEYMMRYFPGNKPIDKKQFQKKLVDEYSLAYSTPVNTGFRARMAIANGSPHMIHLKKDADELNNVTINLNLWTHEIVAPSDPEIIESIIDYSNLSETVQLDSEWIQSKQSAYKMLKVVQRGIEGFSKNVSLKIFGNPLIQVGDTITLSYSLNGIVGQRYLVHSVSHSFSNGLTTSLNLKRIQE